MIELVKKENINNISLTKFVICLGILLVIIIGYSFFFPSYKGDTWKDNVIQMKKEQEFAVNALKQVDGLDANMAGQMQNAISTAEESIKKMDFCLKHDIPYKPSNVWFFLYNSTSIMPIVIIMILILGKNTLSHEEKRLKLSIEKEDSVVKVIWGKCIQFIELLLGVFGFYVIVAFIVGLIVYGFNGNHLLMVDMIQGKIVVSNMLYNFGAILGISLIKAVFCISLFAFLQIFLGDIFALVATIICCLISTEITMAIKVNFISNLLPFKYLSMNLRSMKMEGTWFLFFVVLILYSIVLMFFSMKKYNRCCMKYINEA